MGKQMTEILDKAVARIRELPAEQQDAIAALILEEIEDEAKWDAAFERSADVLERLAADGKDEDQKGLTKELDPDGL